MRFTIRELMKDRYDGTNYFFSLCELNMDKSLSRKEILFYHRIWNLYKSYEMVSFCNPQRQADSPLPSSYSISNQAIKEELNISDNSITAYKKKLRQLGYLEYERTNYKVLKQLKYDEDKEYPEYYVIEENQLLYNHYIQVFRPFMKSLKPELGVFLSFLVYMESYCTNRVDEKNAFRLSDSMIKGCFWFKDLNHKTINKYFKQLRNWRYLCIYHSANTHERFISIDWNRIIQDFDNWKERKPKKEIILIAN